MNFQTTSLALAAFMALQQQAPVAGLSAQSKGAQEPVRSLELLTKLDDLASRPVYILANKADQIDAARDGKQADRTSVDISDFVVEARSAKVEWAVLSIGGFLGIGAKHVLVPYASLDWRPESKAFALLVTKDQLKLLPDFDASKAIKDGMDRAVGMSSASATTAGFTCPAHSPRHAQALVHEAKLGAPNADQAEMVEGTPFAYVPQDYALASHLRSADVYALEEEIGNIEFIAIDPRSGTMPFAVIGKGGLLGIGESRIMVPIEMMSLGHRMDDMDDDQGFWCLPLTKETIAKAPRYAKPENGIADSLNWETSKDFFKEAKKQQSMQIERLGKSGNTGT